MAGPDGVLPEQGVAEVREREKMGKELIIRTMASPANSPALKNILLSHIDEVREFVATGEMDQTSGLFQELYEYFANSIPVAIRRDPFRLGRRIQNLIAPAAKFYVDARNMNEQGVAEAGYPEVDHMPGPTIKRTQTGCKRCHGKGYVYKTPDGEVHPTNQIGAKKYKCGKCDGIGFVKVAEQGVAEGLLSSTEIYDQIESLRKKLNHTNDPDARRFYIKKIKDLEHKLHSSDDPFDIDDGAPISKQGVAEGSLTTKNVAPVKARPLSMERPKGEWDPIYGKAPTKGTLKYDMWKQRVAQDKKGVAEGWDKDLNKAKRKQADIKLGKTEIKTNPNKYIPGKNPLKVGRDMRKNDTTGSKNAFHGMMGGPDLTSNLKIREQEMEDHEIQMASNELTSIAENAARLLDLVKKYSEMEGLEAWQQSKITKAADYLNSVLQSLNGEQSMAEGEEFNWNTADTSEPGQHAMQSKHNAGVKKWEDMLAKYTNDPEMTKHLKVLRINGLRPDFAEIKSQNWISGKEKLPKWYAKAAAYLPKLNTGLDEGDSDNFTIDDIKQLEQIADLDQMKSKAFELISRPSRRPMKPEKIEWFKNVLASKVSRLQVIKLMYDLFLSGEGLGALGTKNSMGKSSYRQRFSKEDAYMESLSAKLDLVSAKKSKN